MKKSILILVAIATGLTLNLYGIDESRVVGSSSGEDFKKVGAAGSQFLKIGIGARANGMGGAFSAVGGDLSSIFWNPAGIYGIKGTKADFSYTQYFADFTHSYAAVTIPVGEQFRLAASFVGFSSGDIPVTTVDRPEGTGEFFRSSDVSANLTFAGKLTEQFTFGITGKYINNSFYSMVADGFAFDVGTQYETGLSGIKLGFSIHNLGSQQRYQGQPLTVAAKVNQNLNAAPIDASFLTYGYTIPITFRAGISGELYAEEDNKIIGAFDFATLSDAPEQYAVGLEYGWKDFLYVRAGYVLGHDQNGLGAGFGLKYQSGDFDSRIDYSVNPTQTFGLINRLTVAIGLN